MLTNYQAECGRCNMRASPLATLEHVERALIAHFTEQHPEHLARLRATIQAGRLPVGRREPAWEPMPV